MHAVLLHWRRTPTVNTTQTKLALLDVQVACLANQAMNYLTTGLSPKRLGNAHPNIVPYQDFPSADGNFILAVGNDGQFRKYRISLIDGKPYACHMAISSNWMIHYVNAFMYEDAKKREEEAAFLNHFEHFAARHQQALQAIYDTTQLDYLGIDCGETQDGELLVFEIDPAMVVHAMDSEEMFPHKQVHMNKVKTACRELLLSRAFAHTDTSTDALKG